MPPSDPGVEAIETDGDIGGRAGDSGFPAPAPAPAPGAKASADAELHTGTSRSYSCNS